MLHPNLATRDAMLPITSETYVTPEIKDDYLNTEVGQNIVRTVSQDP